MNIRMNTSFVKYERADSGERRKISAGRIFHDFERSLLLIADTESLQASIAERFRELTGCDRVILFQPEPGRFLFTPHYSMGIPPEELSGIQLRRRGTLAKWLLVNETCLVVSRDRGAYEYLGETEREVLKRYGIQLCAPLISVNRLIGIVMLGSDRPNWRITEKDAGFFMSLAAQFALALENSTLYRQQRERLGKLQRAENLAAAGQLAAGIAHEIRNPLTAIRSTIQYVLPDYPESDAKSGLLRELITEVDRIDGTLDGLLSLTRAYVFDPVPVDICETLEHSLLLVRQQARRRNVNIEYRHPGGNRLLVRGVANELKQVFLNLLLNALAAVPEGGSIKCDCSAWEPGHDGGTEKWVQVSIEDSGAGILPEHMDRVFDPFFTTKRDGTGLGLAVCHSVIQRHEGEIDLQSTHGKGTIAAVRLPLLYGNAS
jgi:signal transduction histidine kinase